jgi:excinuclease UvrABC helicase subunit UvrB
LVDDNVYYNQKTLKNINKLVKSIKKDWSSILYGQRGTGKTNTISYICDKLDRIVIFIPNTLIESTINNQEFRHFWKSITDL